jgi:hypothetical protein
MSDFVRYLSAKRGVDDRSLNRRVWERLQEELGGEEPVLVVDIGAGIGTGAERMRDWQLVEPLERLRYTAIEPRGELLDEARRRLAFLSPAPRLVQSDLEGFANDGTNRGAFGLVVAHALLDIVELSRSLDLLAGLARPGGLVYLPITFDGETIFEPALPDDEAVLSVYHRAMDERGSSRTGRRLFHALKAQSLTVLEMGASDWVVHPSGRGYRADEAFFLHFLLDTIEGAVRDRVESRALEHWIAIRRRQVEAASLVYCAHQFDYLARSEP